MYKLKQGNCLELMPQIPSGSVDLILTDIPYGEVNRVSGGLRNLDKGVADTFDNNLLEPICIEFSRVCKDNGSIYIFCGTKQISPIVCYLESRGFSTRVGAWNKTNPSPMNGTTVWLSGLEFCVFGRRPKATFTEHCKKALWDNPSGRSKVHPTEKPVALFERLVKASSLEDYWVLDPFMGSGTTGVAAVNIGRNFIGIEQEAKYFEIAKKRIEEAAC